MSRLSDTAPCSPAQPMGLTTLQYVRLAPRRRVLLLACLALSVGVSGLLSGCGSVGDTLARRNVSVVFEEDRTPEDVMRVRESCDGAGGAKALPAGPDNPTNRRYPLRFDVTGLDGQARGKLLACLDADPSVRGFQDSESTGG